MATGTSRMAKSHVVVRQLNALEGKIKCDSIIWTLILPRPPLALGAVTDICSDKTGTLTAGKMIVRKFWLPSLSGYSTSNDTLPTEYVVDSGADAMEPAGDVYVEMGGAEDQKKEMLDLQTHVRAKELVLCSALCNVATYVDYSQIPHLR